MTAVACPICGASAPPFGAPVYDDRYGYPGEFLRHRCPECRHVFLPALFTPAELTALYTRYYPRAAFDVAGHRPHVERSGFGAWLDGARSAAFRWVPPRVRVLDVGCGFCESLGYHRARGCEAVGVEVDANAARVAAAYGYRVDIGPFDGGAYPPGSFDYVTLEQVLEHMQDPLAALRGVARVLAPGGTAVVTTPNAGGAGAAVFGARWVHWHAPYHQQFFSVESMRRAAGAAGLRLTAARTITNAAWLHYQSLHLLTRPAPGEPSAFWSLRPMPTLGKKIARRALTWLHAARIDHLVTRAIDAAGRGDNFVFVLQKP